MNDFQRDNNDLKIINNDLVLGDATAQHQADIVRFWKGWNHFTPMLGVGLERWLLDTEGAVGLTKAIRNELERDGQTVDAVRLTPSNILVEARYE
jgi:hypothetical protein